MTPHDLEVTLLWIAFAILLGGMLWVILHSDDHR